jgi:L-asparaginase II
MLAACRANGWPLPGYRLPGHTLQRRVHELVGGVEIAVDGCGLPTYAMRLSEAAALLLRTPPRIAAAMQARPDLVGGEGADDTELMRLRPGWLAKRGAEGLLCAVGPDGGGLALKVEDGNGRAVRPALGAVLGIEELRRVEVRNSRGEVTGTIEGDWMQSL